MLKHSHSSGNNFVRHVLQGTDYLYCALSGLFVGTPQVGSPGASDSATGFYVLQNLSPKF